MEKFPTPENNEKIEKETVLEALRTKGPEDPETKEMVIKWTIQREAEVDKENTNRASIIFNIERTDLYLAAGDVEGALEHLEDVLLYASQVKERELYNETLKKINTIEENKEDK